METTTVYGTRRALAALVCAAACVCAPDAASAYDDERGYVAMGFAVGSRDFGGTSFLVNERDVVTLEAGPWLQSGLRYDMTFEMPVEFAGGGLWTRATGGVDLLFGEGQGAACVGREGCAQTSGVAAVNAAVFRGGLGVAVGGEVSVFSDVIGSLRWMDAQVYGGGVNGKGVAQRFDMSARLGLRFPINEYGSIQLAGELGVLGAPGLAGELAYCFGW